MPTRHTLANTSLTSTNFKSVLKDSWSGLSKCFLASFLLPGGHVVFYCLVVACGFLSLLHEAS